MGCVFENNSVVCCCFSTQLKRPQSPLYFELESERIWWLVAASLQFEWEIRKSLFQLYQSVITLDFLVLWSIQTDSWVNGLINSIHNFYSIKKKLGFSSVWEFSNFFFLNQQCLFVIRITLFFINPCYVLLGLKSSKLSFSLSYFSNK